MPKTTTRSGSRARTKPAAVDSRPSSSKRRLVRHLVVAVSSAGLVGIFWATRSNWDSEMRLWKAVGDAAFVLLVAALAIGPIARLVRSARGLLRWRRQLGIWFALTATLHAVLILNGWARWSLRRFLGYEFIPQLGREARPRTRLRTGQPNRLGSPGPRAHSRSHLLRLGDATIGSALLGLAAPPRPYRAGPLASAWQLLLVHPLHRVVPQGDSTRPGLVPHPLPHHRPGCHRPSHPGVRSGHTTRTGCVNRASTKQAKTAMRRLAADRRCGRAAH